MRKLGFSKHGLSGRRAPGMALLALLALAGGCRQDMRDQPRLKPLAANSFFADGRASRSLPEHTVARGHLALDTPWFTGKADGQFVTNLPVAVSLPLLQRGQERFGIYCAPCHGAAGTGEGMIVQRGYIQPRSYHDAQLRGQPVGYYFDVITRGFGNMPDYAAQVPLADRWAIVAYIRALQFSQNATWDQLAAEDRERLLAGPPAAEAAETVASGNDGHHE